MSQGFALNADSIVELIAAIAALISLFIGVRQFMAKKWIGACLCFLGACLWVLILVFFLTFHIRLM